MGAFSLVLRLMQTVITVMETNTSIEAPTTARAVKDFSSFDIYVTGSVSIND